MPVTTEIDVERGIIIHTVVGELSADEAMEAYDQLLAHPNFQASLDVIWDISDGTIKGMTAQQMQRMTRYAEAAVGRRGQGFRQAVVTPRDIDFGVARMYQAYAERLPLGSSRVFRSLPEAHAWILDQT